MRWWTVFCIWLSFEIGNWKKQFGNILGTATLWLIMYAIFPLSCFEALALGLIEVPFVY